MLRGCLSLCRRARPPRVRCKSYLGKANLDNVNQDLEAICRKIDSAKEVLVMAGAGLSTASGIPDFRSPTTGIYSNLKEFNLPYPEALFELEYFRKSPQAFNTWCKEFWPGENYHPNLGHYFLKLLEDKGKLSRVYTQNIDGLEAASGLPGSKVIEAHGTFTTAHCTSCGGGADIQEVRATILADRDPVCPSCGGWVKPSIVFFGEALPPRFFDEAEEDCEFCDLLICMGTSLEVYPFAGIVDAPKHQTSRLLINYDLVGSIGARPNDMAMLGDIVMSVERICERLEWKEDLLEVQLEQELGIQD